MVYNNPDGIIAATVIVQFLVIGIVCLRILSRRKQEKKRLISDWLILAATLMSMGLAIAQIYGAANGPLGLLLAPRLKADPSHAADMVQLLREYNFSFIVIGIAAIGLIKISVSLLYLQIFSTRNFRPYIIGWTVIMVIWTIGFLLTFLSLCGSHGTLASYKFTNAKTVDKFCGTERVKQMDFALVVSGSITDLITVMLPIPMTWSLQLSLRRKISIIGIFLVGMLSVGASVARTYISLDSKFGKGTPMDQGLGVTATCLWTLIEIQLGILAACSLTIRPILHEIAAHGPIHSLLTSTRSLLSGRGSQADTGASSFTELADGNSFRRRSESRSRNGSAKSGIDRYNDPLPKKNGVIHVSTDFRVDTRDA
ncbi:hypothetical protein EJ05DRAFT_64279 [Pseudovirgaria hyperparasitica]|uniref:Rhodopsin domain-containing protein n=1 Tax=Pseudovirgaria hyperparasitica TaxID=470096 RepID=A0A6A6W344_9PEZI|nr:uncharacterized protein EJ05DRAFT_64279 [Pseudovirgaria hyperparasitica]KAF2756406.1 hypothetical protein EJ05DRAFT_64279 [Pseudovirgaria hyperparasitica]